ncbi:MAG TPA: TA system VapC family ribonuclease toxin [Longimicrobiales bacterium]|nr:TA system VapC family ribonuclease toxin [Longimicrobiales bacterium]
MILVDVNLLVYAKMATLEKHEAARTWLEGRLGDVYGVGLPWTSLLGFMRLTTNHRIFERPLSMAAARAQVDEWLALRSVFTPEPTGRHATILAALLRQGDRPRHVPDAHLAALAIEYGLTLQTTDRDFARFSGLRWENPIEEPSRGSSVGHPGA